nr:hypothetical protein [Candidatus Saccharibacteria bacterium]NIV03499.1 hypothetical protein [Calditrichia bacterium]NIV73125.1 hypothetical protein [Calditrichia bacterium]NIV98432.1 hypothetical protein [Candidatus Saccharibacteria bacterium]NIW78556.1 hypothetical protein [Calditrichia bacterium]
MLANYEDALADAQKMKTAVDELVENPTPFTLEKAKNAW